MPGWIVSVTTVRARKDYGRPVERVVERVRPCQKHAERRPDADDQVIVYIAGPCGSRVVEPLMPFPMFVEMLQDYAARWGRKPLGSKARMQGAQHYQPSEE